MKYEDEAHPLTTTSLDLDGVEPGVLHRFRVVMSENATGNATLVPAIVLRGEDPSPVIGFTAAIHGNELNGIPVIHRLLRELSKTGIEQGTIVAVPIANIPGYLRQQREFEDGVDLNRVMPGAADGDESEIYAHRFVDRVIRKLDYLIDLHTASFGRVNSLYVRADMDDPEVARLARLVAPQIIVHSPGGDGTLRGAAGDMGIKSITVEVGDPQRFQGGLIRAARLGIQDVLEHLGVTTEASDGDDDAIECSGSYWTHTDRGGILHVLPKLVDVVEKDEKIAELRNVWGEMVRTYRAPERGIIVGKSTNPAARAGSRVVHLGILKEG